MEQDVGAEEVRKMRGRLTVLERTDVRVSA